MNLLPPDFFDALVRYQITPGMRCTGTPVAGAASVTPRQDVAVPAITIGAASKLVDRLERDGTAHREPNPNDRRSSLIATLEGGGTPGRRRSRALRANLPAEMATGASWS